MLSYQHGFHAGNFADVHKHLVLMLILLALNKKSKPWSYLETHSGRGLYELSSSQALKTEEHKSGIGMLWELAFDNEITAYLDQVRLSNQAGPLACYPGSPLIAAQMAREKDRLHLMELHPQEVASLKRNFRYHPQVGVHQRDGYEGVLSLLPPTPNRGLVLVDPAYELKTEYDQVAQFIEKALVRWPKGCFAIWYPVLSANRWQRMVNRLVGVSGNAAIIESKMLVAEPEERGMYGSAMVLINPPWQIDQQIERLVPALLEALNPVKPDCELTWLRKSE